MKWIDPVAAHAFEEMQAAMVAEMGKAIEAFGPSRTEHHFNAVRHEINCIREAYTPEMLRLVRGFTVPDDIIIERTSYGLALTSGDK